MQDGKRQEAREGECYLEYCPCIAVTVSRKASGESGQNDGGLERWKGHSKYLQKGMA